VRARRVQRKGDDSVVKLRPVVPQELPPEVRMSDSFGVEVDALPGGFVCSGSMKAALGTGSVRAVMVGDQPIRKLFSKEQRRFYAALPRARARRPVGARPDLRLEAEVHLRASPAAGRGDVAVRTARVC
jgi:hypothetical protein